MAELIKDKAKRDAESVLSAYWAMPGDEVDPARIAAAMGMVVRRHHMRDNVSGMLEVNVNDYPIIYVDAGDVPQRQRFTIAHEIGHFYERTQRGDFDFNFVDYRGDSNYDAHEFYADEFAGNLLMPKASVKRHHEAGERLAQLAHRFNVSLPAMKLRLRRLDLPA